MEGKTMQSVQYSACGGVSNLKHVEGPIPSPKPNEVLVKVEATGIHLLDVKILDGTFRPFLPPKFPFTPGSDAAGEIVQVGSRVSKFKVGDKVVFHLKMVGGGLAEYAVVKEELAVILPSEVSAVEAAGLPIAGFTAYQALTQTQYCGLKLDGTGDRKNILITAASGSTGHYAVQLAKLANVHITATCGARNLDFVKSLGADEVLDYRTPEGAALKSPSGKKYDYVINGASGTPWSAFEPNLATKGRVIDITPPGLASISTFFLKKLTFSKKRLVIFTFFSAIPQDLEYLVNLVREKKLKTIVDLTYPLTNVEDGWKKVSSGRVTGKVSKVLTKVTIFLLLSLYYLSRSPLSDLEGPDKLVSEPGRSQVSCHGRRDVSRSHQGGGDSTPTPTIHHDNIFNQRKDHQTVQTAIEELRESQIQMEQMQATLAQDIEKLTEMVKAMNKALIDANGNNVHGNRIEISPVEMTKGGAAEAISRDTGPKPILDDDGTVPISVEKYGIEIFEVFNNLKQVDNVEEYNEQFEELQYGMLFYNPYLPECYFISSYVDELKGEIKALVKLSRPKELVDAMELDKLHKVQEIDVSFERIDGAIVHNGLRVQSYTKDAFANSLLIKL